MKERAPNDCIFDATNELTQVAIAMSGLADAFYATGNTRVAQQLDDYIRRLIESRDLVKEGWTREIRNNLREAEQSTANMLETAFACLSLHEVDPNLKRFFERVGEKS